MSSKSAMDSRLLRSWEQTYDATREDIALRVRGEFLKAFPLTNLPRLQLSQYVIGLQSPTFCTFVEAKTRPWANIQGATSEKFGIYFGKTKSDPTKKYRFTRKFGQDQTEAFRNVKSAVLSLINLGSASNLDFKAIDANPLSQMFKAKILSLYFPKHFLNVCSREHLEMLGEEFGYGLGRPVSEYQHLLVSAKESNTTTRSWSNPKFMAFLYEQYVRNEPKPGDGIHPPKKKSPRKVNFEDIQNQRDLIGKAAEEFALEWEKQRLLGAAHEKLISKIKDLRDRPGYGYDFLSHTAPQQPRFIEVKSVGKLPAGAGHRFFLSDNEYQVSISTDHQDSYFFYLVFFDSKGKPTDLHPIRARDLYKQGEKMPASYVVRFELGR